MSAISTVILIVLVLLAVMLAVAGVGIYFLVKLGTKATVKAKQTATRITTHVNAMGQGEAAEAERLRLDLQRELTLTRQAVAQAHRHGWDLGDLPHLLSELTQQADIHDGQLAIYAQQRRMSPYVDHATLGRLREHQAKLTSMCARIRADLLGSQVQHASSGIDDLNARTELEIESHRRTPDPLDEIDELYSKTMQERRDLP
ncbi:hypothetical protein ACIBHX_20030 [Nonomuraea sp. NPDC050536]|uniref:hypothetical protein n=1 Tax=Nonomuraea sp. NPDC050536 TaxID=3364366 RepID=UPI0037C96730